SSERFAAVWLNPHGSADTVSFDLTVQRQPSRSGGLGLAYDRELGGRAWLGYSDHRLLGMPIEGSAVARIGTLRDALQFELRSNQLLDRRLFNPLLSVELGHEDIRRFDTDGHELAKMSTRELDVLAGYEHEYHSRWWFQAGVTGTAWHDSTRANAKALGLGGSTYHVDRQGKRLVDLNVQWTSVFSRANADAMWPLVVGDLNVTPRIRYGWGDRLPQQLSYTLGGDEGFPGLHIGERRGDREAYASTLFTYHVLGPLLLRLELAEGSMVTGGDLIPTRGWIFGARTGLGIDTPVGPIRAEYGYNSLHRGAVFVRVGRWF
ncbi:MAG: hypothetical protein ABI446_01535, partial [Gemmatimonadaceae bacterium]